MMREQQTEENVEDAHLFWEPLRKLLASIRSNDAALGFVQISPNATKRPTQFQLPSGVSAPRVIHYLPAKLCCVREFVKKRPFQDSNNRKTAFSRTRTTSDFAFPVVASIFRKFSTIYRP